MTPYYEQDGIRIFCGDCLDVMKTLPADSVDSIVTDPPYGLSFMGKDWDHGLPGVPFWDAALRVAKPGAHLLAFGGTRTYHRLACAIEDAGWEIRDCISWVYGSGFPKSLDVSKAIDKAAGVEREVVGTRQLSGYGKANVANGQQQRFTTEFPQTSDAPATDAAKQWDGWGTALKPSFEPIVVARKPLIGTVAANVLTHGTGAINVDGCRIGTEPMTSGGSIPDIRGNSSNGRGISGQANAGSKRLSTQEVEKSGRFPANLIHDGSDEVTALFPETTSGKERTGNPGGSTFGGGMMPIDIVGQWFGDSGSAARFFYCAKADSKERRGSNHPTVKPLDLMRYLVRLVTPVGAIVLDPFAGSGTTLEAAQREHCRGVGIEQQAAHCQDAKRRLDQPGLF